MKDRYTPEDACPVCGQSMTIEERELQGIPKRHYICRNPDEHGVVCGVIKPLYDREDER